MVPANGFPTDGSEFEVELQDGRKIAADLIIPATGQSPNNQFLRDLEPTPGGSILNPANGFINVLPTLQFKDPKYSHFFAAGDIADSGAHKAARPGIGQARVVSENIVAMIAGKQPIESIVVSPPAIHLTLGLVCVFPGRTRPSGGGLTQARAEKEYDLPQSRKGPIGACGQHERRVSGQ